MTDLLVLGLATWQAVETWRHGSIFLKPRAFARTLKKSRYKVMQLVGELLSCMFCFSHWVGGATVLVYLAAGEYAIVHWALWTLAVVRLAQLGNDVTHDKWNRSPPGDVVSDDEQFEFIDPSGM